MWQIAKMTQPDLLELHEMGGQANPQHTTRRQDHSEREFDETRQRQDSSTSQVPKGPEEQQQRLVSMPLSRASSVTARERPTDYLHTALWPLIIFLAYTGICLYPWIVFCIIAKKPIGSKNRYDNLEWRAREIKGSISRHEAHILAAEVLQSIASLLTIPVTSAICSTAAVAFMQAGSLRTKMNLVQLGALADQGWASPKLLFKLRTGSR